MDDVKKRQIHVHRRIGEMSELQKTYGLRVCMVNVGYVSHLDSYYDCRYRKFEFYSISNVWDGGGKFWTEETGEIDVKAPAFVMVAPGVVNRYGGANGLRYAEDALTFYGPVADSLYRLGVFKTGVFPTSILRRIPSILKKFQDPSEQAKINVCMDIQNLLLEIYNERLAEKMDDNVISKILCEIENNIEKWYQVRELAEMADMSISTFRRKFQQKTGVLPKKYIEELKIHRAANDIISSNKKILQIAAKYGYYDSYHFSRRFKTIMGCSPEQYRKTITGK